MKKHILLITSIMIFSAQARKLTSPTQLWDKQYGVHQLSSPEKIVLADGLYYLLRTGGNEVIAPKVMQSICSELHDHKARNAFLKAYEKTALASHKAPDSKEKWTGTLLPYYAEVLGTLKENELKITVGPDFGKKLPTTFFELDRALNPQPKPVVTVFEVKMPGFTFQSMLVH